MIPFYAEELSNINVLRASISADSTTNVAESLVVKNNVITLGDQTVADLSKVGVNISMENLVIAQPDTTTTEAAAAESDGLTPWEIKLTLSKSQQKPMHSQQADVKDWWTAKTLLDGEEARMKEIQCQHCSASILDSSINYKIKDLPSEHWYELVECWICHETKPEEHRARMRPILARPNVLLVGTTYFLIHPDNIIKDSIQVDSIVLDRTNWDRGTLTKWIAFNCARCKNAIGEGQLCIEDGDMKLLAIKLFKYCITLLPALPEQPVFTDYFVSDLVNTAKIHATHRFIIEGRQNQKIYTLIWLFNWDTNVIYNNGYADKNSSTLKRERVIKVIYLDCRIENEHTKKFIQLWSNDKSTDHLTYPDAICDNLVNTLNASTLILPPFMRKINHPAMIFTQNFSIGFIRRSD